MTALATTELLTLWQLDTTMFPNGQMFYFSSAENFDIEIFWGGNRYVGLPMDASGFEMTTAGPPVQPTITLSNLYGAATELLTSYNGLVGADVSRIQTLRRFLDDGSTPDPNAWITWDKYTVAQKTSHTVLAVVFKLAARMDQQGTQLPRRLILRDICTHVYRNWVSTSPTTGFFDYSKASCPYTAAIYFDVNNQPYVSPVDDQCSRTMTGCSLRFGGGVLPARFFPGVGKVK